MSTEQVEQFLLGRKGLRTCVRFYQRADGTLLTGDCAVGKKAKRKKQVLTAVGSVAIGASALGLGYGLSPDAPQSQAKPACHIDSAPAQAVPPSSHVAPAPTVEPGGTIEMQGELAEPEYTEILGDVAYEDPDKVETEFEVLGEMVANPE